MKNQTTSFNSPKRALLLTLTLIITCFLFSNCSSYKSQVYWSEETTSNESTSLQRIPIYQLNRLILIKGQANGESGYFIFDTGAPGLILNEAHFDDYMIDPERSVTGVNGEVHEAKTLHVHNLTLGEVKFKYQNADIVDLNHIERKRNVKILGLLGVSLFKGLEIEIDLKKHLLTVYKTSKQYNEQDFSGSITMPFKYNGSLIEIEGHINDKSYRIAFDTGAETLLLDAQILSRDNISTKVLSSNKLLSTDGSKSNLVLRQLDKINIGLNLEEVKMVARDLKKLRSFGLHVDGLIGYDLLAAGVIKINFRTRHIHINPYQNNTAYASISTQL